MFVILTKQIILLTLSLLLVKEVRISGIAGRGEEGGGGLHVGWPTTGAEITSSDELI